MKKLLNKSIFKVLLFLIIFFNIIWISTQITNADTTTVSYVWTANDLWGWSYTWNNINNTIWNTTSTSANSIVINRNTNSNFLSLTNFNLSTAWLPIDATINWIQVDIEWMVNGDRIWDNVVQLTKDGTNIIWNNYALIANWPTTKTITNYGSLTDLWWATWNPTDLLSSNFWVILQYRNRKNASRTVDIFRVMITIDYTKAPPTPWWVTSWLQLWLKADAGTSTITDWTSLTTWGDQSWNGYDASWWVSPTYINNSTTNLNYNPIIDFNWTTQYLENLSNWAYSHSYFAIIIPDSQIDWTLTGQVPFGFDCNSAVLNTWTCWFTFAWLTLWAFTAAINDEVITHAIWSSTGWRSAQIWTASYQSSKPMLINMNEKSSWDWTEISEKWIILDNYDANTYQTLSTADYRIWMSTDWTYPFPYDWKIAEIINYDSRISILDKQKIESYLSLKYAITLNSWTQDYIASNWTTSMWSTSSAWSYIYDIFGIGRDDASELWQIKSASVNNNNVITIEAIWEWTNINPSFSDIDDFEFLTIANNNWWNTWTATDAPTNYYNLSRYWKVQETGELGTLNLDFDVWNTNYDIPDLSIWTNYYFVYDSDNDNLLSDETPISMTNTIWNIWQISWINLNNLQIFTIATQASTNNIPTDINISNNNINENVAAWTTIWTLSTIDEDTLDTHTYTFVNWAWDTDNSRLSITTNSLSINESPDYELKSQYNIRIETDDWNWWTFQKQIIIYINNVWETINSIIDFEDISDESKYTVTSWTWTRTTTNPYEWAYSIESDNGWLPNTQSCFQITNTFNATWTISFYYNISSQVWADFLKFYIDNIEEQTWSWTVPWTNYLKNDVTIWTHSYKWCYIKDAATNTGSDTAFIDYITFNDSVVDSTPPIISSINYASWTLLPWWNHNIIINYNDGESGINANSDTISLYKWNWSTWWSDIASSGFNLWSKVITVTSATYPTNNLTFWKYSYNFEISDNNANSTSTWAVFYIDTPELIINTWSLDIWELQNWVTKFSNLEFSIIVKTVWAWFDLILNKTSSLLNWTIEIADWNWINWIWYDKSPYTSTINLINTNEIIATQAWSININWEKNIYNYNVKFWANIWGEQSAWNYIWDIKFWLDLDY